MATASNGVNGHSESPVCIVTGGASGMGLAVLQHLVSLRWNVTVVDYNEAVGREVTDPMGDQVMFIKANVADYEELCVAYSQTWKKWKRLDAVFANAGIGDRVNFYTPQPDREDGTPAKPLTAVLEVDLQGALYCAYLAIHFFRKNKNRSGKLIFTSSMAGIYPGSGAPIYTAAKHGVVGLTRALGRQLKKLGEPITVNCLCPGLVHTGLTRIYSFASPEQYVTPLSTIISAFTQFIDDGSLTGQVAECSGKNIYHRSPPEFKDEEAAFIMGDGLQKALQQQGVIVQK